MSDTEHGDLRIIVHTPDGKSHRIDAPFSTRVEELIEELVNSLGLVEKDGVADGASWTLSDKTSGLLLESGKTLDQNHVREGEVFQLEKRRQPLLLQLKVHLQDGTALLREVPAEQETAKFTADLLMESGRSSSEDDLWRLDNKDTGQTLHPHKSLAQNGTLSGHHLYLQKTQPAAIPFMRRPIFVVGLAVLILLAAFIAWRVAVPPAKIAVDLGSTSIRLSPGEQKELRATVTGTNNHNVRWSISPEVGTISTDGVYKAPETLPAETSVTVTATSQADPTKSATITVSLTSPAVVVEVNPAMLPLRIREKGTFVATITGSPDTAVQWSLSPEVGSISEQGIYTAPESIPAQQTITVTATSHAAPSQFASATVTLNPLAITLTPTSATLLPSGTINFIAAVDGTSDRGVTWSVLGPGTISKSGVYSAPASMVSAQTITVKATSHADPSRSVTANITLRPPITVTLNPASATLGAAQQQTFAASVTGSSNSSVQWSVSGPGAITNGVYVAPPLIAASQTATVTATSVADNTKSATARIALTPISISLSPSNATLTAGQQQKFIATVTGSSNTSVDWTVSGGPGSISKNGVYTAPNAVPNAQTVKITATSEVDSSKSVSVAISLMATNTPKPSQPLNPNPVPRVCFYRDINFGGWEQCQYPGEEIPTLGPHNDEISSVRMWGDAQVVIFDKKDFKGRSVELRSDVPDLKAVAGKSWSDTIQSARITPLLSVSPNRVCIYEKANYGGRSRCWTVGRDVKDLAVDGDWSDKVSSIQLFGSAIAVIYRDVEFRGTNQRIEHNIPDLKDFPLDSKDPTLKANLNWNHQISSLQVQQQARR